MLELDMMSKGAGDQCLSPGNAWVRCDDCFKWRRISATLADSIVETNCRWTCKDNMDKSFADCSRPQEKSNSEINAELEISDASCEEDASDHHWCSKRMEAKHSTAHQHSSWRLINSNLFLHCSCKTQTIDEMYVTPPDTDVYAIPKVLAPMPQKYIRCAKSDYGCYNIREPPIDAPRDPLYKSEREISKVFLTKHYRNQRLGDPEFGLDFEEIYVIDSKTKSITRAKVLVTVPEGRNRDRKKDLLVIRDNGTSFRIIPTSERDDPTTVIEREEWEKSRKDMEKHLRKLRDFSVSNWF
ncbi:PLASTID TRANSCRIPTIONALLY ACTIVE protein 6, chloroplastic-like [Diospyros lotus]|uniref:PLASTID TRANSCRIPTIONALLY ACTIVE protein 6, chloroplastic-like n=1 Tax=Diospyros lotus TaxID=55363 RepID=UPI00225A4472|nr:PLASTID TRANSCRIPTIONALLY ACTIVE protein 6, chloroplastic-like [Diospyros lotus]